VLVTWSTYTRGCHEYIPEDYIRALYPYPLRIRAGDANPKCIMGTGGEDISILTDRKCEILSDPYPRYESLDTGIYMVIRVLAYDKFFLEQSSSLFAYRQAGEKCPNIWQRQAAIQPDPGNTVQPRASTRLRCQSETRDFEWLS